MEGFPCWRKQRKKQFDIQVQKDGISFPLVVKSDFDASYKKIADNFGEYFIFQFDEKYDENMECREFNFNTIKEVCIDITNCPVKEPKTFKYSLFRFPNLEKLYLNFEFNIISEIKLEELLLIITNILTNAFENSYTEKHVSFYLRLNCRINVDNQNVLNDSIPKILFATIKQTKNVLITFQQLIIIDDIFYNFSFNDYSLKLFPKKSNESWTIEELHIKNFKFVNNEKIAKLFEFISYCQVKELTMENIFIELIVENYSILNHYFILKESNDNSYLYLSENDHQEGQSNNSKRNFESIRKLTLIDAPLIYLQNIWKLLKLLGDKDKMNDDKGLKELIVDKNSLLAFPMKMQKIKIIKNTATNLFDIDVSFNGDIESDNDLDEEGSFYIIDYLKSMYYECIGYIYISKIPFNKISFKNFLLEENDPYKKIIDFNDDKQDNLKIDIKQITYDHCSPFFINKFNDQILNLDTVEQITIKNVVVNDHTNKIAVFPPFNRAQMKPKVKLIIKDSIVNLGQTWHEWMTIDKKLNDHVYYDCNFTEEDLKEFDEETNIKGKFNKHII